MLTVLTVLATFWSACHGLNVLVTMPSGKQVEVPVDNPRKMTVGEFRSVLKEKADPEDKLYARVVSLCNPHRLLDIDPTPILPMQNEKTLYEQGVYSIFSSSVKLPQSFFAFEDVATKKPIVFTGCEWSTPDDVLALSKAPFREYKANLTQRTPPPTAGKNANAFTTIELAKNAKNKVPVVSDRYCSFTAQFSPQHHVTSIFPCKPATTTVAELKAAVQESIRQDPNGSELFAASAVLCKDKPTQGDCMLKETDTIAQAFGEKTLDLVFPSPASFIRVLVGDNNYDVPVCPAMTAAEVQSQIVARLGLKRDTKVIFERAELAGKHLIPLSAMYVHSLMYHAKRTPVYLLRLKEFDKSDHVVDLTRKDTPSAVENIGKMVATEGSKLFKDRRVLIAVVVLIFGVILISVGVMSSSEDAQVEAVQSLVDPNDFLPSLAEPSLYDAGKREALPEVNLSQPEQPSGVPQADQSLFDVEPLPAIGQQVFEPSMSPAPEPPIYAPTSDSPALGTEVNTVAPDSPALPPVDGQQ